MDGRHRKGDEMTGLIDLAVQKVTFVTAQLAAGSTIYFGLTVNELGVIFGSLTGVSAVLINAFFQWRRDRREERIALRMEREARAAARMANL